MIKHTLKLHDGKAGELRVPADLLCEMLGTLLEGARQAARFAIEGTSTRKGPRPGWVDRVTAIDVTGLTPGSTVIDFEAPTFGEADTERFGDEKQGELFDDEWTVMRGRTAVELFGDVLAEGLNGNREKVRADRGMLDTCIKFISIFRGRYSAFELFGPSFDKGVVKFECDQIDKLESLRDATPEAEAVRVCGLLDTISASRPVVILQLNDGTDLRVRLEGDVASKREEFFNKKVVVSGMASFLPSGRVGTVVAESIELARDADDLFARMPTVRPFWSPIRPSKTEPEGGVRAFFGIWPGDETDEELLDMVRRVREQP